MFKSYLYCVGTDGLSIHDAAIRYRRIGYESLPFHFALNHQASVSTLKWTSSSPIVPEEYRTPDTVAILVKTVSIDDGSPSWKCTPEQADALRGLVEAWGRGHEIVAANFYIPEHETTNGKVDVHSP